MHVVVNTSSLPIHKKYRIASLLCIFETLAKCPNIYGIHMHVYPYIGQYIEH